MGIKEFIALMRRRQGTSSMREFAFSLKVSVAAISDIYLGNRIPGPKIARALGYNVQKTSTVRHLYIRRKAA
jgi:hypothetical protein